MRVKRCSKGEFLKVHAAYFMVVLFIAAKVPGREEISSKCTIPAHDKAVRGIGVADSPLLLLHITQPIGPNIGGTKVNFVNIYIKHILNKLVSSIYVSIYVICIYCSVFTLELVSRYHQATHLTHLTHPTHLTHLTYHCRLKATSIPSLETVLSHLLHIV